jgi:hypothetical protein
MELKKTHIFLQQKEYIGMSGQSIECIKVLECRVEVGNLASNSKSIYLKEVKSGYHQILQIISEKEFINLNNESLKVEAK